jgi:hypothetical protein
MTQPDPPRARYRVLLEVLPGQVPGEVSLRRLLKHLGRRYGLDCLAVEEDGGDSVARRLLADRQDELLELMERLMNETRYQDLDWVRQSICSLVSSQSAALLALAELLDRGQPDEPT